MTDLTRMSASRLHDLFVRGEVSSREITEAHLDRIVSRDDDIHAFLSLTPERALRQADEADLRRRAGETMGPLGGVPVAVKDIIVTKDVPTTAASRILQGWVPPYDATCVERLGISGMPVLGKTNLDEFAMGSSTETSAYVRTVNPHDRERVPGGSSGGSAAAVAAYEAPCALGSETGGSVRQPSAYCGVVGVKPTYGRVSRFGLIAFSSSMDQIGPLARTVEDAARLLGVVAGADERDMTSAHVPVPDYAAALGKGVRGLAFAMPDAFTDLAQPAVAEATEAAAHVLEEGGARRVEVDLSSVAYALQVYYIIAPAEASSNLARFDGVRYGPRRGGDDLMDMYLSSRGEGFGAEVKRRIMLGTFALSEGYVDAFYRRAQEVRRRLRDDFARAFESVDFLLTPTTPDLPFKLGAHTDDPLAMYAEDIMTIPANLVGVPAMNLPAMKSEGLPIGVQLIGRPFTEALLFQVASHLEAALPGAPLDGASGGGIQA